MPPHERAAAVRERHERCTLPIKPEPVEPLSDRPVRVNITQWALPGLGIMSGALCGLRQHVRPKRIAPTGADDAFLNLSMAGVSVVNRRGNQVVVPDGDASLVIRGAKGFNHRAPHMSARRHRPAPSAPVRAAPWRPARRSPQMDCGTDAIAFHIFPCSSQSSCAGKMPASKISQVLDFIGALERIRTADPQIRSLMLYPAELRARPRSA